jgi:hypothetical protein
VNTIREAPVDAAIGAGLLLAGLPVYWYYSRKYVSSEAVNPEG